MYNSLFLLFFYNYILFIVFNYFEPQRMNLQFIKEPFINVNYGGESTNDIKQRQAEGIALAKKQGKHLGIPPV